MRRLRRNDGLNLLSNHLLSGRVPMMTLVHTLAVAEYLNFRHAANAPGVAQSSVSARVKALEEDLGILLCERHARGVRLTEAGRHFVERIAVCVDQRDHAVTGRNWQVGFFAVLGQHSVLSPNYDCFRTPNN